jgi:uracil-DNA glycosylase
MWQVNKILLRIGWEKFTTSVIEIINKECNSLVFFLWGAPAQKKAQSVNDNK